MKIQISTSLKKLREEKGITQSTLAAALSVSSQAISRWENSQAYPDIEQLPEIASFFGVTIDELLGYGEAEMERLRRREWELRKEEKTPTNRYELWTILGKQIENNRQTQHRAEYYGLTLELYKQNILGYEQVEKVRAKLHAYLVTLDADALSLEVSRLLYREDEKDRVIWKRYIQDRSDIQNYRDALLCAHRSTAEYTSYLPDNLWERWHRLIQVLCMEHFEVRDKNEKPVTIFNAYDHHKAAMDILNLFSKVEDDVCLPSRIVVGIYLAAACFQEGRDAEGFACLTDLCRQIPLFVRLMQETAVRRGSTPMFAPIEKIFASNEVQFTLHLVHNLWRCSTFDKARGSVGGRELQKTLNRAFVSVYSFRLESCPEKGITEEFVSMFERADALIRNRDYNVYAVMLLMTASGRVFETVYHMSDFKNAMDALTLQLEQAGDTEVRSIVYLRTVGFLDYTPKYLCDKLIRLNPKNENAKHMYGSRNGMYVSTIGVLN